MNVSTERNTCEDRGKTKHHYQIVATSGEIAAGTIAEGDGRCLGGEKPCGEEKT